MRRFLLSVVLCIGAASRLFAWGNTGHELVAEVATAGLDRNARQQVSELLEERTPAQVGLWADLMRAWQRARQDRERTGDSVDIEAIRPLELKNDPVALSFSSIERTIASQTGTSLICL